MLDDFDDLDPNEKAGVGAELNRCRALAAKIANELRNKRPEHFVDKVAMADIHASLERAADGPQHGEGFAGAGPSASPIIAGDDLRFPTLSRARHGPFES